MCKHAEKGGDTLTKKQTFLCQGKISKALSQNDLSV